MTKRKRQALGRSVLFCGRVIGRRLSARILVPPLNIYTHICQDSIKFKSLNGTETEVLPGTYTGSDDETIITEREQISLNQNHFSTEMEHLTR